MHDVIRFPACLYGVKCKFNIIENDVVPLATMRALVAPILLRAIVERIRDRAGSLDRRCGHIQEFGIVIGDGTGIRKFPWITLGTGRQCPSVAFVTEHLPHGCGSQGRRSIGADDGQRTAREGFFLHRVAAVSALGICHLAFQPGTIPDHRRNSALGELLGIVNVRLYVQHGAGILVDGITDAVQNKLGFADL